MRSIKVPGQSGRGEFVCLWVSAPRWFLITPHRAAKVTSEVTQFGNPLINSWNLHHCSWANFPQIHSFCLIIEPIRVKARDATAGISQNAKVMRVKDGAFTGGRRRGRCETSVKWESLKRKIHSQWDGIRPDAQLSLTGDNLVSILCPDDVIS